MLTVVKHDSLVQPFYNLCAHTTSGMWSPSLVIREAVAVFFSCLGFAVVPLLGLRELTFTHWSPGQWRLGVRFLPTCVRSDCLQSEYSLFFAERWCKFRSYDLSPSASLCSITSAVFSFGLSVLANNFNHRVMQNFAVHLEITNY